MDPIPTSARLAEAFAFAAALHGRHNRKGTTIPYVSHLMQVAGLVLEAGGDENLAIAGLLHDAIEDAPGGDVDTVRSEIQSRFGSTVLRVVEGCSDTDVQPKPPWRERKESYVAHLADAEDSVLLVSAADKLHNARSILTDLREEGDALWERFNAPRQDTLWYYRELVNAYQAAGAPERLTAELDRTVSEIERLVSG